MSTMCFFHEPLELKKISKEHLPINHLVPSPFLCVHALDREKTGFGKCLCLGADLGILYLK